MQPLSPFQRVLPPVTIEITSDDIIRAERSSVGRVGDLKAEILKDDLKARLSWTAPDMGGHMVSRYEIRYAMSVSDIVEGFDTTAHSWENGSPFPLSPGSETTFTLDFSQEKGLLDRPLYFAVRAFSHSGGSGAVSNWARVLVASPPPPPPPTVPPTSASDDRSSWPFPNHPVDREDAGNPSVSKSGAFGLELILPVAIGFILLLILLIAYCYFCVVKRRRNEDRKKSPKADAKNDHLNSTITIVPNSPGNGQSQTYAGVEAPDPHTVGVPINYGYEDDTKKRYSLVQQQEQQLIEELKQQQMQPNNNYAGLGQNCGTFERYV